MGGGGGGACCTLSGVSKRLLFLLLRRAAPPLTTTRRRLNGDAINYCNQDLKQIAADLKKASSVLCMAGAGLSTPSGIPDFRSPGSGIYDNLKKYRLPYPEAIFDIEYFKHSPAAFNSWAKEFLPGVNYKPNIAHFFIRMLHEQGRLTRLYTQNVDGLELLAGIPEDKIVFAHGSFTTASCVRCGQARDIDSVRADILSGDRHPACDRCGGFVKPDLVFFGEMLPERFQMYAEDAAFADYLVCVGTSLEVYPFAGVADAVPLTVPRLLINRDLVGSFGSRGQDQVLPGDLVESTVALADAMGCGEQLRRLHAEYLESTKGDDDSRK